MKLEGSCHCGAVTFSLMSRTPYPFNYCYCSKCRKTTGGGGFGIHIMGDAKSLEVKGEEHLRLYRSRHNHREIYDKDGLSFGRRNFCGLCGTQLWNYSPQYPDWVYPCASAIDTPLPEPPARTHLMLAFKAPWVEVPQIDGDKFFDYYPDESIEEWHRRHGLYEE